MSTPRKLADATKQEKTHLCCWLNICWIDGTISHQIRVSEVVSASPLSVGPFSVLANPPPVSALGGFGWTGSCSQNCPRLAGWKCQGSYKPSHDSPQQMSLLEVGVHTPQAPPPLAGVILSCVLYTVSLSFPKGLQKERDGSITHTVTEPQVHVSDAQ